MTTHIVQIPSKCALPGAQTKKPNFSGFYCYFFP
jgi:hypothetical protein